MIAIQLYYKCESCGEFTAVTKRRRASKYCGRPCQNKAYYQRKKRKASNA